MASLTRSARALIAQPGLQQVLCRGQIRLASTAVANKGAKASKSSEGSQDDSVLTLSPKNEYTTGICRLREHYRNTVQDDLMVLTYNHHFKPKKVAFPEGVRIELKGNKHIKPVPKASSPARIPELVKIDIHCMMKEALDSKFNLLSGFMAMQAITGEMPEIIRSKKGVHAWKLRAGNPIGCKVTLRGDKMYQFLDKVVEIVLPKMKEWPGLPESAGDATGNIGMGFPPSSLSLFPEIESNFDMYPRMTGFHVTFNTTAESDLEARLLLSGFNLPFQQKIRSAPVPKSIETKPASA
ncbi:MAG: ribosomal protein L5 domain-containing protein [Benniella sp.]|nr:MAG: ribosomal protein L5 domain-containing protein [Benniella sp.]